MTKKQKSHTIQDEKFVSEKLSESEKIWKEIKDTKIDMFSLPDQVVSQYCKPVIIEEHKLYLTFTVSSVVAALEQALNKDYDVEMGDKFIFVTRKTNG